MAVFCKLLVVLFVVLICRASEFGKWDFYAHGVEDVLGRMVRLDEYRGKVSLVVNVASECGYTDGHYRDMVKLQEDLGTEDFAVLAFPCNQFGNQEPHDDIEIEEFVRKNYGINFPLFSKIEVRGQQSHSIYAFLKEKSGSEPTWNFWKYLINREGEVVGAWGPRSSISSIKQQIVNAIKDVGRGRVEL